MKRSPLIIAISLLLLISLISCGAGDAADTNSADTQANDDTAAKSDEIIEDDISNMKVRENAKDNLPGKSFDGKDFTILQRTEWGYEFSADSENGDTVNDAVYKRNLAVEDRFNVKLNIVEADGVWGKQDTFINMVVNSVAAGDGAFDLIAGYAAYMPRLSAQGLVMNLHELPYLDFEQAWWSTDLMNNLTINGKMFFTTGDISLSLWEDILAIYFNKQLIADYNVENPYDLVRSGKWTIDKLAEICKGIYVDVNGDGQLSEDSDIFGYATDTTNFTDAFYGAFDSPVIKKDDNGIPYHAQNTEKMASITEKIYNFMWNNPGVYANPISSAEPENLYRHIFEGNRAMFIPELLGNAQTLRGMDTDFGIIPYPKWDEAQENYLTTSVAYFSLFCVPVTETDLEMAGIITEALCFESYKTVIPAFYDVALKSKYSRDDDSAEMLDTIRNGLTFDFGKIYVTELAYSMNILRNLMTEKRSDSASEFAKNEKAYDAALEKVLQTFE